jgi:hypothetical protein
MLFSSSVPYTMEAASKQDKLILFILPHLLLASRGTL